ncbi:MAG: RHS repeat-associated core domain-containing protein [Polyangiaceae bacterium]
MPGGPADTGIRSWVASRRRSVSPGISREDAPTTPGECNDLGMCAPRASKMLASLVLTDTPVGYTPQLGPDVHVRLSYNHLDTLQPDSPNYSNLGPRWTHNFLSYVQDDPTSPGDDVTRYARGGGAVDYTYDTTAAFNGSSGAWGTEVRGGAILQRNPATGTLTSYTLTHPDGSVDTYAHLDGGTTYPRRVFLTSIADPQGKALTLAYDGSHRLTTITDATGGRATTFCYDPTRLNCAGYSGGSLLISRITDPFNRSAKLNYTTGQLASIEDVLAITSTFTYDSGTGSDPNFIKQLDTPYGTSSFTGGVDYDTQVRWLELTDPELNTERIEYNGGVNAAIAATESSTPSGMTVENGEYDRRNTFYWDKSVYPMYGTGMGKDYTKAEITHWAEGETSGRASSVVASIKKPLEGRVFYSYPGQPSGHAERTGTYDKPSAVGRILDNSSTQLTQYSYNTLGHVTQVTDPLNRVTKYTYDTNNIDLIKVEQQTGSGPATWATLAEYTYDTTAPIEPPHKPLTHTDAGGNVWTYTYNANSQLETEETPDSEVTTYGYDADGRLETVENANSVAVTTITYNMVCGGSEVCDLPETVLDIKNQLRAYTYDALDRVLTIETTEKDSDTLTETFNYTAPMSSHKDMDLLSYTDKLGRTTYYAYDDARRLEEVQDPETHTVGYEYYKNGLLKKLTDQNGSDTEWTRDVQGRVTLKTFDDTKTTAYAYETTTSRLKTVTDALSQVKTYSYDTADERTGIAYTAEVNSTPDVTYTYGTWYPRLESMTDGIGTTAWTYVAPGNDGALQVNTENGPFTSNDTVDYDYDNQGRIVSMTVDGTTAEEWTYDNLSRIEDHTTKLGVFNYTNYWGETNLAEWRELSGHGVTRGWNHNTWTDYDRKLIDIYGNSTARAFGIDYDLPNTGMEDPYHLTDMEEREGDISGHPWAMSLKTWHYTYDDNDRLEDADDGTDTFSHAYDDAGNLTTIPNPTNASEYGQDYTTTNALDTGFTHDYVGNRLTDTPYEYKWDAEDRLIEVKDAGYSTKTNYTYDGLGRRLTSAHYNGMSTTTTRFQWCGETPAATPWNVSGRICAKRNSSDTVLKRYYEEGEYDAISPEKWLYMKDQIGSVRDVVDVDGLFLGALDYTPYGYTTRHTGVSPDYAFAGLFNDSPMGVLFSATRAYDAWDGRWLSRDPIAEEGGINLYEYANGNPVMFTDPSGLSPDECDRWTDEDPPIDDASELLDAPFLLFGVGKTALQRVGSSVAKETTYLYQKLNAAGQHMKYGVTDNLVTRYTKKQLSGGRLKPIAKGSRDDMLKLERKVHETLPVGSEEGQLFYIQKQVQKGLKPPPYGD